MNRTAVFSVPVVGMIVCLLASSTPTWAASSPYADAFWLLPVNAREVGLGQATMARVNDATAFHWNPAGLGMVGQVDVVASYSHLYRGLGSHQALAAAAKVGHNLAIGAGWVHLGVDEIPYRPSLDGFASAAERSLHAKADPLGYFTYAQNAFLFTLARQNSFTLDLGWQYLTLPLTAPVGVTVKYLTASAGDSASASGLGIDVGAQSHFLLSRAVDNPHLGTISFGLVLANIGRTRLTWDSATERADDQAMRVGYGVTYEQPLPFLKGSLVASGANNGFGFVWGFEYRLMNQLYLRTGKGSTSDDSIALGAGLAWKGLHLDYALQRHPLGATHRVSLQYQR